MIKNMRRRGKYNHIIMGIILIISVMFLTKSGLSKVLAENEVILVIPSDAKIYLEDTLISEDRFVSEEALQGRIHEIASQATGTTYSVKKYRIPESELSKVKVYDWMLRELSGYETEDGVFDYTQPPEAFQTSMEETVKEAGRAYYNRVAGLSSDINRYFASGSNAYNIVLASDNATKWGRFIAPGKVKEVTCSDIFAYSDCAFSATATVLSEEVNGFHEEFALHMLFQNNGNGWYVTDFTFMP